MTLQRKVYGCGQNAFGELSLLGDPPPSSVSSPSLMEGQPASVMTIAAGNELSMLITVHGAVYACGLNGSGQCGISRPQNVPTLERVQELENVAASALGSLNGSEHQLILTSLGELYVLGNNSAGQLGLGTASTQANPIPRQLGSLRQVRVKAVACSYHHSFALTELGAAFSWGRNDSGQLALGDTMTRLSPQEVPMVSDELFTSVSCGLHHTVLSTDAGKVYACGKNDYGQLGTGVMWEAHELKPMALNIASRSIKVACGYSHTLILSTDGEVCACGRNDYGQLGLGHKRLAVQSPTAISYLRGRRVTQLSCGSYHSLVVDENGRPFAFGRNNHGQLGIGSLEDSTIPQPVTMPLEEKVARVAAGFFHSLFLTGPQTVMEGPLAQSTLGSDLSALVNNPLLKDIEFLVDGHVFYGHRCIIMMRCDVMSKMLQSQMMESTQDRIEIRDIESQVFLALLEFIYTDDVRAISSGEFDYDFAFSLLASSNRFLLDSLTRKCELALEQQISLHSVCRILQGADSRFAHKLRTICINYVISHYAEMSTTPSFQLLPDHLKADIVSKAERMGMQID